MGQGKQKGVSLLIACNRVSFPDVGQGYVSLYVANDLVCVPYSSCISAVNIDSLLRKQINNFVLSQRLYIAADSLSISLTLREETCRGLRLQLVALESHLETIQWKRW